MNWRNIPWKVREDDANPNEAFIDIPSGYIEIGGARQMREEIAAFIVKAWNEYQAKVRPSE